MNSQLASAAVARLLRGVAVVFLVVTSVFILSRATGDPISRLAPPYTTDTATTELQKEKLGLNDPLIVQYGRFLHDTVQLDFGTSFRGHVPAIDMVRERILNTVMLGVAALGFAFAVGIPLGVVAAVRRGGPMDLVARIFALLGQAVPNFWLGLMLILFLAVNFDFLPTGGRHGVSSIILPAITLGSFPAAAVMRFTRSSMLDTLQQDYIRTRARQGAQRTSGDLSARAAQLHAGRRHPARLAGRVHPLRLGRRGDRLRLARASGS